MADEQNIPLSVLRSYSPHPDKLDLTGLTQDEITHGIKSSKLPDYIRYKQYLTDTNEALAQLAEMIIQFAVNLSLDPDQTLDWARKLQQALPQSEFDSWVATLLDGGPSIFMNTLSELQTTYPNGAAGVALVRETDPAKIYVWNGTAWEDFGDYQGIEVKDLAITTNKLADKSVVTRKLGDYAVRNENLYSGSVDSRVLGNASVTAAKMAEGAVGTAHLRGVSVTSEKIAEKSIEKKHIKDLAKVSEIDGESIYALNDTKITPTFLKGVERVESENKFNKYDIKLNGYYAGGGAWVADYNAVSSNAIKLESGVYYQITKEGVRYPTDVVKFRTDTGEFLNHQLVDNFDNSDTNMSVYIRVNKEDLDKVMLTKSGVSVTEYLEPVKYTFDEKIYNIQSKIDTNKLVKDFKTDKNVILSEAQRELDLVKDRAAELSTLTAEGTGLESKFDTTVRNINDSHSDFIARYDSQIAGNTDIEEVIDARYSSDKNVEYVNIGQRFDAIEKTLSNIYIDATNPPAGLTPLVADANYYSISEHKYYTDASMAVGATNNTEALQAIIDYVHSIGGGTIYLPAGRYMLGMGVSWKSTVSLIGAGRTISTLVGQNATYDFSMVDNTTYSSYGFDANKPEAWIEDFVMSDFGIDMKGLANESYSNVGGKGLFMLYLRRVTMSRIYIQNTIGTALGNDFLDDVVYDNIITRKAGRNWGKPLASDPTRKATVGQSGIGVGMGALENESFVIQNCSTYDSGNYGIFVEAQTNQTAGVYGKGTRIIGNYAEGNRVGIANRGMAEVLFANNISQYNIEAGLWVEWLGKNDLITGNILAHNEQDGFAVYNNYGGGANVIGNKIFDNGLNGIRVRLGSINNPENGIYDNIFKDNVIYENTNGIHIDGNYHTDNVIQNNTIYDNNIGIIVKKSKGAKIIGNLTYRNTLGLRITAEAEDWLSANNVFTDGAEYLSTDGKSHNDYLA